MNKSLIFLAALTACAAMSSTAFTASAADKPAVIDTGQALALTPQVPAEKQQVAFSVDTAPIAAFADKKMPAAQIVTQANLRELHPAHVSKI